MTKSIYTVSVPMESQEQCDRMLALCVEYGLNVGMKELWTFDKNYNEHLAYFMLTKTFFIMDITEDDKTQVTEQEFIKLLKNEPKIEKL
jgi:hypothetical protein